MADLLGQHRAIAAQDAFTATTLQYIVNLECRLISITNPGEPTIFPPSGEAQHLMATYSELSRARYDKLTQTNRRAEAMGLFINSGMRRPNSPLDGTDISTPEYTAASLPYGVPQQHHQVQLQPLHPPHPHHMQPSHFQNQQLQQPHFQLPHPHHQHQLSYFTDPNAKQQRTESPTTPNAAGELPHNSHRSFANFGEIRLGSRVSDMGNPVAGTSSSKPGDSNMSYFPAPGAPALRPSLAITPGAVMVSTLTNTNHIYASQSSGEGLEDDLTPNSGLTAVNTSRNQNPTFLAEGEDIAAFAAALKGGQSSAAVRSALTSKPLLVRRATYIPGWSIPPRVLLVEDDPVCRNLTTKFLQLFGCTIEVATDGVEAVNKMQSGVYDIAMMDITMPNLDGKLHLLINGEAEQYLNYVWSRCIRYFSN